MHTYAQKWIDVFLMARFLFEPDAKSYVTFLKCCVGGEAVVEER
jgi:hypothetical protein